MVDVQLFFVRHAQSMGNLTGDYSTTLHGRLSDNGVLQAERLAKRLNKHRFDHILVSPIERAMQTIAPYLRQNAFAAEIWGELSEACWQQDGHDDSPGPVRFGSPVVLSDEEKEVFRVRGDGSKSSYPPEHETYAEGLRRTEWACQRIKDQYMGTQVSILVVGHGHSGSRLIEMLLGIEPIGRFDHENTAMTLLRETSRDRFQVAYANRVESSHCEPL